MEPRFLAASSAHGCGQGVGSGADSCPVIGCAGDGAANASAGEPGAALPGLSEAELQRFEAGRVLFDRVYLPENGLGPLFNENQCSACHTVPASGGTTGFERVVRATRFDASAGCDA